eukprot:CAMPEP_0174381098 /NCGR_PEP_ID=MMETSP0811_2-20130205/123793_1 /TAXON_ID=73025 ORGANISM="Eutreptiella gymnastica-like, Strain CCMP1594" /NCGR_SAMPLE_ID=MMETSP0811_2 /ASSEMBLY_ACC=CAM_ASM_000667 /LENGTH=101 /DNA_ID=CAMNT_0015534143 /DNA_START=3834 /DNA_END=4140 /DNA_ORIENTATION=+
MGQSCPLIGEAKVACNQYPTHRPEAESPAALCYTSFELTCPDPSPAMGKEEGWEGQVFVGGEGRRQGIEVNSNHAHALFCASASPEYGPVWGAESWQRHGP